MPLSEQDRLDLALNEILEQVSSRLRPGWTIRLVMAGLEGGDGEASIEFENPDGTDMEPHFEQSESTIWHRVEFSRKPTCSQCGEPATCIGVHEEDDGDEASDCRCSKCCKNDEPATDPMFECEHLEPMQD